MFKEVEYEGSDKLLLMVDSFVSMLGECSEELFWATRILTLNIEIYNLKQKINMSDVVDKNLKLKFLSKFVEINKVLDYIGDEVHDLVYKMLTFRLKLYRVLEKESLTSDVLIINMDKEEACQIIKIAADYSEFLLPDIKGTFYSSLCLKDGSFLTKKSDTGLDIEKLNALYQRLNAIIK